MDPYKMEYDVETFIPNKVVRVNFHLGFRIQPRLGIMLQKVGLEMCSPPVRSGWTAGITILNSSFLKGSSLMIMNSPRGMVSS